MHVCVCVCVDYTARVAFRGGSVVKNLPAKAGYARDMGLISWSGRSPRGGKWQPTPVFLLWKSHRQRSLAGCRVGYYLETEHACMYRHTMEQM